MIKFTGRNKRFEAEVNLGLLAIIFVLLFINLAANYVIHNSRQAQRDELNAQLHATAEAIAREWRREAFSDMNRRLREDIIMRNKLSDIAFFPDGPKEESDEARRDWGQRYMPTEPGPRNSALMSRILRAEYDKVESGEDGEYYLVRLVKRGPQTGLLMVAMRNRLLAYLDSVGQVVVVVSLIAGILILGLYLLLSRYITAPFKRLRHEAEQAGREMTESNDEVEAVIEDYRRVIEELRQKEQELLEANRRIQGRADSLEQYNEYLLSSISSGIISIDPEKRLVSINRAAGEMLGIEVEDYIGRPFWDLFQSSVVAVNAISRTMECGQSQPYQEGEMVSPSGRELTVGVAVSVVIDRLGETVGTSVVINDLTELISLRRQLEAKNRLAALGEMAGGLAHQLRNSLGAIVGYARLIGKRMQKHDLSTESVNSLQSEAGEAESLIERFLYFSRPFDFSASAVDLRVLLEELVESIRVRNDDKKLLIRLDAPSECPVEADALLLKQAIANLIDNAVNAYPEGKGEIALEVICSGTEIKVSVRDFGSGIPQEDISRIFTPFYSSRPGGTGLGLPLVSKIVELHGGQINIESSVGEGTTVTISLPRNMVGVAGNTLQSTGSV
ncbi:MAG TPA: ATP-binding protein [candidate division Zixibacteria bacterium]|nr:ATP-binding protein [candidate division Zixibacteria bacterium]